jgi:predicted GNAT family acetyltransferase
MHEIKLNLNKKGKGAFLLSEDGQEIGDMAVEVSGNQMTVLHTEVKEEKEGKGFGRKLFDEMVKHARANQLKVRAVCPYVRVQFMRNRDSYADIWNREEEDAF